MAELVFTGVVRLRRFQPDDPVSFANLPERLEGKRVRVLVKRHLTGATRNQHGYYRSTVLPKIADHCGYDTRDLAELEQVHVALKMKFLGVEERGGLHVVPSHADLDVEEMTGFLDSVLRFASENGIYVPGPEERWDA